MKQVFVTGADGMLGSSICRELLVQGYQVKAMCLPGRETNTLNGLSVEKVLGDISDKDFLLREMKGCDYVIHVAALTNLWPRKFPKVMSINLDGAINVMEATEHLKMERMIHIGTANSFANGTKEKPGDENSPYIGWKYGMDYIDSKYLAQQKLLAKFKETGFPVVIINPTYMIGPFDSGPSSGQMLIAVYKDILKWYSSGGKSFVCATDVAKAAVNSITKGTLGECYIAGNENLTYNEFFLKACMLMQKPFKMRQAPYFIIITIGFFGSLMSRITRKPPKISYGMALLAKENQYYSSAKAQRVLEMPQTPIEVGISECLEWFKENKYL